MADEHPGTIEDALFELRSAATDYDVMMSAEGFDRAVAEIRRDQAEKIIEWIESKNLGGVYPDFQNETEYHAAIRTQFGIHATGGEH